MKLTAEHRKVVAQYEEGELEVLPQNAHEVMHSTYFMHVVLLVS